MSDRRLVKSVQRIATALARLERQTATEHDVSVSQLRVLMQLAHDNDGVRVSDLAQDQGLAVSTMTRNLGLLEKKGLVTRVAGKEDDKRTVVARLTDEGLARSQLLTNTTIGLFGKAFHAFHPSDRVERAVAVDRVAAALEKVGP